MNLVVAEARQQLPRPMSVHLYEIMTCACLEFNCPHCYCVGGALLRSLGIEQSFPTSEQLAAGLVAGLTGGQLDQLPEQRQQAIKAAALAVIEANDNEQYEQAWQAADHLVTMISGME